MISAIVHFDCLNDFDWTQTSPMLFQFWTAGPDTSGSVDGRSVITEGQASYV
jgi:hypothetical protein